LDQRGPVPHWDDDRNARSGRAWRRHAGSVAAITVAASGTAGLCENECLQLRLMMRLSCLRCGHPLKSRGLFTTEGSVAGCSLFRGDGGGDSFRRSVHSFEG
jgi:hypothetical protein